MLAFVFTTRRSRPGALQSLLKDGVEDTFNAVTIWMGHLERRTRCSPSPPARGHERRARIGRASDRV